ncbi:MAG: DUF1016 N-terminal domain-containing protein [Sulfurimonas sp.]|nr:DUF1016 N-terminal domain-containing protein [Sulfurimonas sp.]
MNKITDHSLFEQIKNLIEQTKQNVAITINSSFDEKNLRRMMQFANIFEKEKVVTLSRELSWSHILALLPLKDRIKKCLNY